MRVLLVDDQPLFLEGLQNLLSARGLKVVGTAGDGLEALTMARTLRPDVVLMDIQMPRCNGLEAARAIKAEMPEVKIVMLTVCAEDKDLFEAIRSGASGYLLKSLDAGELCRLLSGLAEGEPPLSRGLTARILAEVARKADPVAPEGWCEPAALGPLTMRQADVLALVAQGLTYKEIGAELCLTERTVKYHMGRILEKLNLRNRMQAILYARQSGLTRERTSRSPATQ